MNPLLNPVLIAVAALAALLSLTGTPYPRYFAGAQFVRLLLGPATAALAVPLLRQWARLRRVWFAAFVALLAGSTVATASAVRIARGLGPSGEVVASLAPKSVTAPVAMAVSQKRGGAPSLTAVVVLLTGVHGAMLGPSLLERLRLRAPEAHDLALGVAGRSVGTARALQEGETQGAFSGLGMGLNALATSALIPLLWWALSSLYG